MPFKEPFMLGPFSVDAQGKLSLARPDISPGFSIRWRSRVVHARIEQGATRDGHLRVQTSLGRVPSTASGPGARAESFSTLREMLLSLPKAWNVRLLPDHQPRLELDTIVSLPITVTNLVAELAQFLLALTPYLDILDRVGVTVAPFGGESGV